MIYLLILHYGDLALGSESEVEIVVTVLLQAIPNIV